jgi:hypothetical protein
VPTTRDALLARSITRRLMHRYFEQDWTRERWTRGCPVSALETGVTTDFLPIMAEPFGLVHWPAPRPPSTGTGSWTVPFARANARSTKSLNAIENLPNSTGSEAQRVARALATETRTHE